MGDLFHERVEEWWLTEIFAVMTLCPEHTFQILTKRPHHALDWLCGGWNRAEILSEAIDRLGEQYGRKRTYSPLYDPRWYIPNVWLGVSVEDQRRADERVPLVAEFPTMVRWLSIEPMLERIDPFAALRQGKPSDWLEWLVQVPGILRSGPIFIFPR